MKAYVLVTGAAFGLLVIAHIARIFLEGAQVAREPVFAATTIAALGMTIWSWRIYKQLPAQGSRPDGRGA